MDGVFKSAPSRWPQNVSILILLGLAGWHGWMIASLFSYSLTNLTDDRPILSGRHPLHLYHGFLGANSLLAGRACCYDPAFQAGYPKTPVFDSGSRPAELWLVLARGAWSPAAYKIGLAAGLLTVPLLLFVAARSGGLDWPASVLAVAGGLLVWWGHPCRQFLETGDVDLLFAIIGAVAHVGLLMAYDRAPGFSNWLGLVVSGTLGVFANPFVFLLLVPVLLVYYLTAGPRHSLGWHLALLVSGATAVAANSFWLLDWLASLWIHLPLALEGDTLVHRTLRALWEAPSWGTPADRALTVGLFGTAAIGMIIWRLHNDRVPARSFAVALIGLFLLAAAGISWQPLGRLGTSQLLLPALLLALIPAAHAFSIAHASLVRWTGRPWRATVLGGCIAAAIVIYYSSLAYDVISAARGTRPLRIGLDERQETIVAALKAATDPGGRILLEEETSELDCSDWTALLPVLTGRAFLGGLGGDAVIEHGYARLLDQRLAGRPIGDWSDDELDDFCKHYNVNWIACWSPAAVNRLRRWHAVKASLPHFDGGDGCLFTLEPHSYILKGEARWLSADSQRITLANVVPAGGKVVLSLHYHRSLHVWPSRVRLEREPDPYDPIPFVRLRLPGPASLVTLSLNEP
jgi:hypothetical protein